MGTNLYLLSTSPTDRDQHGIFYSISSDTSDIDNGNIEEENVSDDTS